MTKRSQRVARGYFPGKIVRTCAAGPAFPADGAGGFLPAGKARQKSARFFLPVGNLIRFSLTLTYAILYAVSMGEVRACEA